MDRENATTTTDSRAGRGNTTTFDVLAREKAIAHARLEKARAIAAYLKDEFFKTVESCTPEERQNVALKAGRSADKPPSDESWQIVLSILKGE